VVLAVLAAFHQLAVRQLNMQVAVVAVALLQLALVAVAVAGRQGTMPQVCRVLQTRAVAVARLMAQMRQAVVGRAW